MRILILSNLCPPYAIGGYEIAAVDVANMLKRSGHEVAILTSNYDQKVLAGSCAISEIIIYRKLRLIDSWYKDYDIESIKKNKTLNYYLTKNVIEDFRPEVLYAWNQANLGSDPIICAEKMNIPIIHHLMSSEILMYAKCNKSWKYVAKRFLRDFLCMGKFNSYLGESHFKNIIYISDFIKKDIEQNHIFPKRYSVIYPSVEIDRILPKTCYRLMDGNIKIVYLGQVASHKGILTLVHSLNTILEKSSLKIDLTIFGGGDIKLVEAILDNARNRFGITVTGMIDKLEIYKNLKNYDLGVFPSEWDEPFGISQLELMCAGLPIISSGRGGSAEVLVNGENGLLYRSGDIDDLSSQILHLVNYYNEIAEKLGRKARDTVVKNFNPEKINRRIISFIKSVAHEN